MATQKATDVSQHIEGQLKERVQEIKSFLDTSEQELQKLATNASLVETERRSAFKDLERTERALRALTGADEPSENVMATPPSMGNTEVGYATVQKNRGY